MGGDLSGSGCVDDRNNRLLCRSRAERHDVGIGAVNLRKTSPPGRNVLLRSILADRSVPALFRTDRSRRSQDASVLQGRTRRSIPDNRAGSSHGTATSGIRARRWHSVWPLGRPSRRPRVVLRREASIEQRREASGQALPIPDARRPRARNTRSDAAHRRRRLPGPLSSYRRSTAAPAVASGEVEDSTYERTNPPFTRWPCWWSRRALPVARRASGFSSMR